MKTIDIEIDEYEKEQFSYLEFDKIKKSNNQKEIDKFKEKIKFNIFWKNENVKNKYKILTNIAEKLLSVPTIIPVDINLRKIRSQTMSPTNLYIYEEIQNNVNFDIEDLKAKPSNEKKLTPVKKGTEAISFSFW